MLLELDEAASEAAVARSGVTVLASIDIVLRGVDACMRAMDACMRQVVARVPDCQHGLAEHQVQRFRRRAPGHPGHARHRGAGDAGPKRAFL
jgi:hypothetical protein